MYSYQMQTHTRLMMASTRVVLPLILLGSQIMNAAADVLATSPQNQTIRFNSLPASFGNPIPPHGLEGLLVAAVPIDGCDPIKPPPKLNDSRSYQFFALIMRGNCEFDVKVMNAQNSNYNGAIVYNDESNAVTTMSGGEYTRQVFIQSVFVGLNSGLLLKGMNYSTGYTVTLSQTRTPSWGYYFLPFISVTSTCLLFFAMYAIAKYVRDQRRQRRARLSRDHLKKLPIKKFKKGDDYDVCAICLDDYEEGQKLRILPCNHAFHCKCIDPWLTNNRRTCPICKRKVVPPGVDDSDEESDSGAGNAPSENTPLLAGMENDSTSEHGAIGGASAIATPPPSPVQLSDDESSDQRGDPPVMTLIDVESDSESAGSYPLAEASPDIQVTVHSENELEPIARSSNTV